MEEQGMEGKKNGNKVEGCSDDMSPGKRDKGVGKKGDGGEREKSIKKKSLAH